MQNRIIRDIWDVWQSHSEQDWLHLIPTKSVWLELTWHLSCKHPSSFTPRLLGWIGLLYHFWWSNMTVSIIQPHSLFTCLLLRPLPPPCAMWSAILPPSLPVWEDTLTLLKLLSWFTVVRNCSVVTIKYNMTANRSPIRKINGKHSGEGKKKKNPATQASLVAEPKCLPSLQKTELPN